MGTLSNTSPLAVQQRLINIQWIFKYDLLEEHVRGYSYPLR